MNGSEITMNIDKIERHELIYGEGMYAIEKEYDISYFIKGEYEITDPIVNSVTRPVEYIKNKDRGLELAYLTNMRSHRSWSQYVMMQRKGIGSPCQVSMGKKISGN